jgi:hypothetical protein
MRTLCSLLFALCVCPTFSVNAQQIELEKGAYDKLVKLGTVKYSGDAKVDLSFPDGFIGDEIHGAVLLQNDSGSTATISNVETSCGCTSAIPEARQIGPGESNLLLIDYDPRREGKANVEARFRMGDREFLCAGVANTKPRMSPTMNTLSFDGSGEAHIEIRKHTKTPLDRLLVLPSTLRVKDFVDLPEVVKAILVRDPDRTTAEVSIIPSFGRQDYPQIVYRLRYTGVVEALPRRIVTGTSNVKFFLRGDVHALSNQTELILEIEGKPYRFGCQTSLAGDVLSVAFDQNLEPGDYTARATLANVSFPIVLTVR